jgi:hypothetical protein
MCVRKVLDLHLVDGWHVEVGVRLADDVQGVVCTVVVPEVRSEELK